MANEKPIHHLVVVGFHHKKGYQVDYSYPPLFDGNDKSSTDDINECPAGWKYLPTLALPDGSHNFAEDTVFFNLPSLTDPRGTIYGVSCYRQIPVEQLKILTADVTRSTVQKAVCVLATVPLYGYIEVKLSLIAQAFFDQGDFSNTEIIRRAYDHLNACLIENLQSPSPVQHIFVGLPIRDTILKWRHKILILFKLMLLQKRVVCFGSPVKPTCSLILSILSLHPKLLEHGLGQAACVRTSRPMSPMPDFPDSVEHVDHVEHVEHDQNLNTDDASRAFDRKISVTEAEKSKLSIFDSKDSKLSDAFNSDRPRTDKNTLMRENSVDTLASSLLPFCTIEPTSWGAPFPIFTNGTLCLPYLSLPYMDLLSDPSVNGYIIGTSNILFRQKRQIMDVLIDVENTSIETQDQDLRRQLTLTTEDLRFVDFVVRQVQFPKEDAEGSEQWIREQFQGYMMAILRTAVMAPDSSKDIEHFNVHFINAWRRTSSYQDWLNLPSTIDFDFEQIPAGHPFAGTLSVGDMKLKIAQTMNSSESGRKLNQAVNTTSKAVGGALSQAKGAFSNFWSAFTAPTAPAEPITPKTIQPPIDIVVEATPTVADEVVGNETEETKTRKSLNGNRPNEGTGINDQTRIVEIAKEADAVDSARQIETGQVFDV